MFHDINNLIQKNGAKGNDDVQHARTHAIWPPSILTSVSSFMAFGCGIQPRSTGQKVFVEMPGSAAGIGMVGWYRCTGVSGVQDKEK